MLQSKERFGLLSPNSHRNIRFLRPNEYWTYDWSCVNSSTKSRVGRTVSQGSQGNLITYSGKQFLTRNLKADLRLNDKQYQGTTKLNHAWLQTLFIEWQYSMHESTKSFFGYFLRVRVIANKLVQISMVTRWRMLSFISSELTVIPTCLLE